MLRYKTKTRPGLVALYDIRPGIGAGPFLQPRSQHRANIGFKKTKSHLTPLDGIGGCSSPSPRTWVQRWRNTNVRLPFQPQSVCLLGV